MENLNPTAHRLANYNSLSNVVIMCSAITANVETVDIMSASKVKEAALARALAVNLLTEYDFGVREIGRLINSSPKSVNVFQQTHLERMELAHYSKAYTKAKSLISDYYNYEGSSQEQLLELKMEQFRLNERLDHLQQLLTN